MILGLLAVAAAALLAFAGMASATTITSPTGTVSSGPIHALSEEGAEAGNTHIVLHNSVASIGCDGTIEGTIESQGAGQTAQGSNGSVSITSCTNSWTVTVQAQGSLEVHWTSGYNGTLTSSGSTVTAERHTIFGTITCRYLTNATHIGTVTGGNPATLDIEASIPFHSGGGLCGTGASNLTGNAVTTSALYIDQ